MAFIKGDKRINGVIYVLVMRNDYHNKKTAQEIAKKYRKKGYLARVVKQNTGLYDVYIRSSKFEASAKKTENKDKYVKYTAVDQKDGLPTLRWKFYK